MLADPGRELVLAALGTEAATNPGRIKSVAMLGSNTRLSWSQTAAGLKIELPAGATSPTGYAYSFRITIQ